MAIAPHPGASRADDVAGGDVEDVPVRRLIGDFAAFELKLFVDGFKDVLLAQVAVLVIAIELLFGRGRRGRLFYGLMRIGRRFERWLGLYEPHGRAHAAETEDSGLAARVAHANRILRDAERRILETTADE